MLTSLQERIIWPSHGVHLKVPKGPLVDVFLHPNHPASLTSNLIVSLVSSSHLHMLMVSPSNASEHHLVSKIDLIEPAVACELSSTICHPYFVPQVLYVLTRSSLYLYMLPCPTFDDSTLARINFAKLNNSSPFLPTLLQRIPISPVCGSDIQVVSIDNSLIPLERKLLGHEPVLQVVGKKLLLTVRCTNHQHNCTKKLPWVEALGENCSCDLPKHVLTLTITTPFHTATLDLLLSRVNEIKILSSNSNFLETLSLFQSLGVTIECLLANGKDLLRAIRFGLQNVSYEGVALKQYQDILNFVQQLRAMLIDFSLWFLKGFSQNIDAQGMNKIAIHTVFCSIWNLYDSEVYSSRNGPHIALSYLALIISSCGAYFSSISLDQRKICLKMLILIILQSLRSTPDYSPCDELSTNPEQIEISSSSISTCEVDVVALLVLELLSQFIGCVSDGAQEEYRWVFTCLLQLVFEMNISWNSCPLAIMGLSVLLERKVGNSSFAAPGILKSLTHHHLYDDEPIHCKTTKPASSSSSESPIVSILSRLWPENSIIPAILTRVPVKSVSNSPLSGSITKDDSALIKIVLDGLLLESFLSWKLHSSDRYQRSWMTLQNLYNACLDSRDCFLEELVLRSLYAIQTPHSIMLRVELVDFSYPSEFIVSLLRYTRRISQQNSISQPTLRYLYLLYCFSYPGGMSPKGMARDYPRMSAAEYDLFLSSYLEYFSDSLLSRASSPSFTVLKDFTFSHSSTPLLKEFKQLCEALHILLAPNESFRFERSLAYFYNFLVRHQWMMAIYHPKNLYDFSQSLDSIIEAGWKEVFLDHDSLLDIA